MANLGILGGTPEQPVALFSLAQSGVDGDVSILATIGVVRIIIAYISGSTGELVLWDQGVSNIALLKSVGINLSANRKIAIG